MKEGIIMYSMLHEIDKYIKENNIPFKAISFSKNYLPNYINMAIEKEVKKSSKVYFSSVSHEYELRYDKNGMLYILVHNEKNRENFIICMDDNKISEDFNFGGKSEKHIIKWGCLFKLLTDEIKMIDNELDSSFLYLTLNEKYRLRYELIDSLLEEKYAQMIKENKYLMDIVDYEEDMIEATYKLKDYIRYLFNYYNDGIKYIDDIKVKSKFKCNK